MNIPDILGHIGNVGFLLGAVLLARKKVSGFYWQIEGNFFYLIQAWIMGMSSLVILSFILIFINIGGIVNWRRLKNEKN
jgi:Nicotinamide mononucleotide transporter